MPEKEPTADWKARLFNQLDNMEKKLSKIDIVEFQVKVMWGILGSIAGGCILFAVNRFLNAIAG